MAGRDHAFDLSVSMNSCANFGAGLVRATSVERAEPVRPPSPSHLGAPFQTCGPEEMNA